MNLGAVNRIFDKAMPFVTPTGVTIGLLLGDRITFLKPLVVYLFAFITLAGALGMNMGDFRKILTQRKTLFMVFLSVHILTPLIVFAGASLFFPNQPEIVLGFILLSAIPIGVSSFVWCTIYEGNAPLGLTIIILDTLLAPVITPLTVRIFASSQITINVMGIMSSLLFMVVVPSFVGMLLNNITKGKVTAVIPILKPFTKVVLLVVVIINVSQIASSVTFQWEFLGVILMNIFVIVISFLLMYCVARWICHESLSYTISMTFGGGIRNISAALVLAIDYFPPQSTLPVIFGIILQQTIASIIGSAVFSKKQKLFWGRSRKYLA